MGNLDSGNSDLVSLAERRYRAFISYRHADNQQEGRRWAIWLQESLERFEVPKKLIGKLGDHGRPIPESLFPVFRDEDELPANSDLSSTIREALQRSDSLIVICSPRAVASRFVNSEIEEFKRMGKADRILAVIIDGLPNASIDLQATHPRECLPLALRRGKSLPNGEVDWEAAAEPICADVRPDGQDQEGFTSVAAYRESLQRKGTHSPAEIRHLSRKYRVCQKFLACLSFWWD